MIKFHGRRPATFGHLTKRSDVAEHFRERYFGPYHLEFAAIFHRLNLSAFTREIASNITHESLRHHYFHFHNRFKNDWFSASCRFLKGLRSGNFISDFRRIHVVIRTIIQFSRNICHLITSNNSPVHRFSDTLLNGWDKFLWDDSALNSVNKLKSRLAMSVILYFRFARNSFFVRHLRFADISFDGKFALHTVYDNFKVKFTHTHDNRLTRFLV